MAIIKIPTIWLLDKDIALRKDEIRQRCLILLIPAVQNLIICDKHKKSLGVPLNIFYLTYKSHVISFLSLFFPIFKYYLHLFVCTFNFNLTFI